MPRRLIREASSVQAYEDVTAGLKFHGYAGNIFYQPREGDTGFRYILSYVETVRVTNSDHMFPQFGSGNHHFLCAKVL